jgi:hypothetical protein
MRGSWLPLKALFPQGDTQGLSEIMRLSQVPPRVPFPQDSQRV